MLLLGGFVPWWALWSQALLTSVAVIDVRLPGPRQPVRLVTAWSSFFAVTGRYEVQERWAGNYCRGIAHVRKRHRVLLISQSFEDIIHNPKLDNIETLAHAWILRKHNERLEDCF